MSHEQSGTDSAIRRSPLLGRDSLGNSVADYRCLILNVVEIEAAHHRLVFIDEHVESALSDSWTAISSRCCSENLSKNMSPRSLIDWAKYARFSRSKAKAAASCHFEGAAARTPASLFQLSIPAVSHNACVLE